MRVETSVNLNSAVSDVVRGPSNDLGAILLGSQRLLYGQVATRPRLVLSISCATDPITRTRQSASFFSMTPIP